MPPRQFGIRMYQPTQMLPMDYLMNQQRMQPEMAPAFGMNEARGLADILSMISKNNSLNSQNNSLNDLSINQNLGVLPKDNMSMIPNNIGGLLGSGLNTNFATPGLLYTMQGLGGL